MSGFTDNYIRILEPKDMLKLNTIQPYALRNIQTIGGELYVQNTV